MKKTISIIRGGQKESYDDFHTRIKEVLDIIKALETVKIHYTITLEKPPKLSVIPFSAQKIALISVHSDSFKPGDILKDVDGFAGSFGVTEALPIAYEKDWVDGEPTPGICLLTLFRQKKGIEYDTYLDRWHNGHTPFTLKVHPIYHYNRNVVDEDLGKAPIAYDGIVEEHCMTRKELLDPLKFFTKSGYAMVNMIRTYFDVKSFIDYKSIETYLVQEYHVKS